MRISESTEGNARVLDLVGSLDSETAGAFEEKVLEVIDDGVHHVVLDCSSLEYVSSAGLRVFLIAAKALGARDGTLMICSLTDHVRHVLDLSGFATILAIHDSREEAIGQLPAGGRGP